MVRSVLVILLAATPTFAQDDWFKKSVKSVEASFDPATAAPGQTVKFRLTIELNDGYHTYPTVQPDKNAAFQINTFDFPTPGGVIFVGPVKDPAKPDIKAEPMLGIKELRTYKGIVTYEKTAVVSPKAAAGELKVELKSFSLNVCDKDSCYGPKKLTPTAKVTVKGAPVEVEKAWAAEVEKALASK